MSIELNDYIEDSIEKAFITVNNKLQPKLTNLDGRYLMLSDVLNGSATSGNTVDDQRQVAFANAFATYVTDRYNAFVDGDPIYSNNPAFFGADLYVSGGSLAAEEYSLQIIDRTVYDVSTDTATVTLNFIANKFGSIMTTYRGRYSGSKVGSADPTGTCVLEELAPVTFNNTTNSIKYKGTGATGITYNMIRFIDNTTDDYGYSIAIGGGGTTIIGGGESAATILSDNMFSTASGGENMVVANDNGITFLSNVQNGTASAHKMIMDSYGNLLINTGGHLYVGSNKGAAYTQQGTFIGSNGNIALTGSGSANGSGGSIFWAWNGASSSTAYLREYMQGYLQVANNLMVQNAVLVGSGPKTDYYTQQGVGLAPNGNITLTGTTTTGAAAGLYFAYNGSGSYSQWMRANYNNDYGGYLEVSPSLIANYYLRAVGAGNRDICAQNTTTGIDCRISSGSSYIHGLWSNGYIASGASAVTSSTTQSMWMVYRSQDNKVCLNNLGTGVYCGGPLTAGTTINAGTSITAGTTITAGGNVHAYASSCHCYAESSITKCYVSCYSYGNSTSGSLSATHGIYSNGYGNSTATGVVSGTSMWMIYRLMNNSNLYINSASTMTVVNGQLQAKGYAGNLRYVVVSRNDDKQRVDAMCTYTATAGGMYGQWGVSGSTYKYMFWNVTSSDIRLKENIEKSTDSALEMLNKLNVYKFDWKTDKKHWKMGFIAQEVYEIEPELCIKPKNEEEGYWAMNDHYFSAIHTKAIQELSAENDKLKAEISQLKETLSSINEKLKKLEV